MTIEGMKKRMKRQFKEWKNENEKMNDKGIKFLKEKMNETVSEIGKKIETAIGGLGKKLMKQQLEE